VCFFRSLCFRFRCFAAERCLQPSRPDCKRVKCVWLVIGRVHSRSAAACVCAPAVARGRLEDANQRQPRRRRPVHCGRDPSAHLMSAIMAAIAMMSRRRLFKLVERKRGSDSHLISGETAQDDEAGRRAHKLSQLEPRRQWRRRAPFAWRCAARHTSARRHDS
jgi:hypothetical protein